MLTKELINKFYEDVKKLGLKFPVATISKATGFSKGQVSGYLNKKKPKEPSENFINKFYEMFAERINKVPQETTVTYVNEDIPEVVFKAKDRDITKEIGRIRLWQAEVDAVLAVLISEITPLISKHSGKSQAAAFSQLKKDIQDETSKQIALLNRK